MPGPHLRGSELYGVGDNTPITVDEAPDQILPRLEAAKPGEWLTFTTRLFRLEEYDHKEGDPPVTTSRTAYIRADAVWVVMPRLLTDEQLEREG